MLQFFNQNILATIPSFTPKHLFAAGEQGVWYDPSDLSTLFQDSAGTTPVSAVEQPVGLMLDKNRVPRVSVTGGTTIATGTTPLNVVISADGKSAYVANLNSNIQEGNPENKKKIRKLTVKIGKKFRDLDKDTPVRSVTAMGRRLLKSNPEFALRLATESKQETKEKIKELLKTIQTNLKNQGLGSVTPRIAIKTFPSNVIKQLSIKRRSRLNPVKSEPILPKHAKEYINSKYYRQLIASFSEIRNDTLCEYTGMFYNKRKIRFKKSMPRSYSGLSKTIKSKNMMGTISKYKKIDNLVKRTYRRN
jgi:hypothetical protein